MMSDISSTIILRKGLGHLDLSLLVQSFPVHLSGEELDRSWSFKDRKGHRHRWKEKVDGEWKLPSCKMKYRKIFDWESGEEFRIGYYACRKCGAEIKPAYVWVDREVAGLTEISGHLVSLKEMELGEERDLLEFSENFSGTIIFDERWNRTPASPEEAEGISYVYAFKGSGEIRFLSEEERGPAPDPPLPFFHPNCPCIEGKILRKRNHRRRRIPVLKKARMRRGVIR